MSELLDLTVGAVAAGGSCVARTAEGQVVFVRHALPGERVRAQVTSSTTSFLRADAVEVVEASPDRVAPPCPYAGPGRCGGCDWQHVALDRQRLLKADLVLEQLRRLAGIDPPLVVEPVDGDTAGLGWRTRVQLGVQPDGAAGFHRHRSHDLEVVDRCLIATGDVNAVGAQQLPWPGARAVEVTASGAQRVVSISGRRVQLPDVDAGIAIDGRPVRVPHGLRHDVLGRRFEVSAGGFWQVHVGAAAALAAAVLAGLDAQPGERVADLYAGAGLFTALLADQVGPAGSVLSVESDRAATADCARNTADQQQVKVMTADVDATLVARRLGSPHLVVLDPPRAGAGVQVARALVALRPRRIAYVACDPASFARDLRVFLDAGWAMPSLRALDIFPMTEHVELVAVLTPPA